MTAKKHTKAMLEGDGRLRIPSLDRGLLKLETRTGSSPTKKNS